MAVTRVRWGTSIGETRSFQVKTGENGPKPGEKARKTAAREEFAASPAHAATDNAMNIEYLQKIPDAVPDGWVVVHNRVRPTRRLGSRGFRGGYSALGLLPRSRFATALGAGVGHALSDGD
jgi:hypothetical protein